MDSLSRAQIREIVAQHKWRDALFIALGIIALAIGVLTFLTLFVDMVIDGVGRLSTDFFTNFPVDEVLNVRMVHVETHHLGSAARGATRFDRSSCAIADAQPRHESAGAAAAGKFFAITAEA